MADFIFNVAKGKIAHYAGLPATNDALKMVALKSGFDTAATLKDYDTLGALLAGANNTECDATNYARQTLTSVTVTVDDTNDRVDCDADDFSIDSFGGTTDVTDAIWLLVYDPDTTASDDDNIIPLVAFVDETFTTDGSDYTFSFNASGFARAS
jgi:hypothetical protein